MLCGESLRASGQALGTIHDESGASHQQLPFAHADYWASFCARLGRNGLLTLAGCFDAISVPFGERFYVRSR
jgi:hypothetical protein